MNNGRGVWDWCLRSCLATAAMLTVIGPTSATAEELCDPSYEDCRSRLLELIRSERVGIDVAFWFMEDARYSNELIRKAHEGVPVRVLVDVRANPGSPHNADRIEELAAAGIPIRKRVASGILHWKMMLFDGQNVVEFSAANYSPWAWRPNTPYQDYTDEAIYFATDPAIVNSFRTKYDSLWVDTTRYANHANIVAPLQRRYGQFAKDPELNFPPAESFRSRSVSRYRAETQRIDVIMFRITDQAHANEMIAAVRRGVPVRLLTEPEQYRDESRYWHAWNVDRMYMAGVALRHRAHAGMNHQKSVLLRSQRMVIFGSSNWSSASSSSQEEHNYFTVKPWIYDWFDAQFDRKWNNTASYAETKPFEPLPPNRPISVSPLDAASGMSTSGVTLRWLGGYWAHKYDIYFGTSSNPPLLVRDAMLGPSTSSRHYKQFALPTLQPGTTYYWRIVGKTMANMTAAGPVRSFTTQGDAPPPPATGDPGEGDIVLHAEDAMRAGSAIFVADATAAGGVRVHFPNRGAGKLTTALAAPANYVELTFDADAGVRYHLWMRARAESNYWGNDSVHVQFSGSVNSSGAAIWRIGTTSGVAMNLEDCSGCGLSGWGWQDNGWGVGVLGPHVMFGRSGPQTIRIQVREDGMSFDQIVLSPAAYLTTAPGALKNDATILPKAGGAALPGDAPEAPGAEIVLHAGKATTIAGRWSRATDPSAASGVMMVNPDAGGAKIVTALAAPRDYFELTFEAVAGRPYRLWIRGQAERNYWGNDSVHVQFSGTVDQSGAPAFRIGTTQGAAVNLEDASHAGISGWGWQDNGWGTGVLGPVLYFESTGTQRIRIQTREDGFRIDQIVLSSSQFIDAPPGGLKNDATILPER